VPDVRPTTSARHARQTHTELTNDFILVRCPNLSSPSALLETHATIADSYALMVTLVPRFRIPDGGGPKPEIVFVVDRSGTAWRR
jgi:hypothetical protein